MTSYLKSTRKEDCYGCSACYNVCPVQCIRMISDSEGYSYPAIDNNRCTKCRLCEEVCPLEPSGYKFKGVDNPVAYAAWNKNDSVRRTSTSGGLFVALSGYILNNSGAVFGAMFDSNFAVVHGCAETKQQRDKFKGSKYVQSNIGDTYKQVKDLLEAGKKAMFTGTPCQVGGLYAFLRKDYDNLFTVDLVCHGVPSPGLFRDHINNLKNKFKADIESINFRDKQKGWGTYYLKIKFANGKIYGRNALMDFYYRMFLKYYFVRPSCYRCEYTKMNREADITIADFWGIEKIRPELKKSGGVSMVLVNSEKGLRLFEWAGNDLIYERVEIEEAMQPNMHVARDRNPQRDDFFRRYSAKGINSLQLRYLTLPAIFEFPRRVLKFIGKRFKKIGGL
ncbi:MAG TPA: Coenzyme F420 hydrogenase/dehydrogenase, beta subunit C-terminal domain [Methylomusa anaerophila]|uniref:NADH dehydrogenase subunit I n=1 Tax=Methylomusa anaerophila TaxID=1930071 RepID=A0A348AGB8_9FIRM|nr:Coenzyme F420 hydrogenase/dehydrogenase, beta subunit C-terminal domain [Methylomusa anaerophila]BBB90116.1 NADH dehydrogenase subunit I [Methylomusa anaerophila]HML88160.1 Coenzyme F420 hydrogenase/dehydrogenase, beta subunit C-terminal domain [Methylomusa anaerophila]